MVPFQKGIEPGWSWDFLQSIILGCTEPHESKGDFRSGIIIAWTLVSAREMKNNWDFYSHVSVRDANDIARLTTARGERRKMKALDFSKTRVLGALCVLCSVAAVGTSHAGMVYTSEAAFDAALALGGLTSVWNEDFEGFDPTPNGLYALDPLTIGLVGGQYQAEVVDGGKSGIGSSGTAEADNYNQYWLQQDGVTAADATIRGVGEGTSIDLQAISFSFDSPNAGYWSFDVFNSDPDVSGNFGGNSGSGIVYNFIGWIAGANETLDEVVFNTTEGAFNDHGVILDNISAYRTSVVPIPAAAWLFVSALGVFGYLGKRKAAAS